MEEKKEKTIELARKYFHTDGYRKLSLSNLIEEVGMSKPTFYNYFKNKKHLFIQTMLETYNEFIYQLTQNFKKATSAIEKLDVFIQTYAWFLDEFPIYRDLYKPGNDLMPRWLDSRYSRDIFFEGREIIRSILEDGIEEGLIDSTFNTEKSSILIYSTIIFTLSNNPNYFKREKDKDFDFNLNDLTQILAEGILTRN
ncbi:MAG: TetR/AcrR family transcriptional regulator [Spirochaetales bacterium]|nr:TetR/AcrR family transcriptional regulator [Spirochaetales bacterium]